jgi:hypothetical protein
MSNVSLRRLLSKLTALALSASPVGAAGAVLAPEVSALDADDSDLDASLPIDREHLDAHDAALALGRGLAQALAEMRPLWATHLAATWSLSPDPLRRLAMAHALEWSHPLALVGDALVLDHLSHDGDPQIRAAVARAAWARRQSGADEEVLARLSHDPDPTVRAVAMAARSGS